MAKSRELPPQELLKECLRYHSGTGKLFWKERPEWTFEGEKKRETALSFNKRLADTEAFTTISDKGYKKGSFNGVTYVAHRIIYKMIHGVDAQIIDHQDGNKINNRIENLVSTCLSGNAKNRRISSNNTSGFHGVHWHQIQKRWQVYIQVRGVRTHVGFFDDKEEAIAARKQAEAEHGYHQNHGREE